MDVGQIHQAVRKFQPLLQQHPEWEEQPVIPADRRGMVPGESLDRKVQQPWAVRLHPENDTFFDDESVTRDQILQHGRLIAPGVPA